MYNKPSWVAQHLLNGLVSLPARLGLSLRGAQILTVPGRRSGQPRSTPVNPLDYRGETYLIAPRGDTHWVRNLRAAGEGDLRLGRRTRHIRVQELSDIDKPPLLQAYLQRWSRETAAMFGADANTSLDDLAAIASNHPVFRIES